MPELRLPITHGQLSKRRRWVIITSLLVVFMLAGWCWFTWPKTYRVVGSYRQQDIYFQPYSTIAGFLLQENRDVYVMRDWTTGRERWHVTTAPAITRHWPDIPDRLHEIGISPNGRYLCIATPASGHLRLQFWCDGTSTGEWLLSLADLSRLIRPGKIDNLSVTLLVCDNGRSYLTIETQTISVKAINNRTVLYAFDDNQLVATDCPPYIPVKVQFSPDGRTVMFQYPRMLRVGKGEISHTEIENVATVARVTIERMQLTYTDKRTLPYYSGLEANETVLTENKIENLDGTLTWSTGNWDMMESSINGRYLLLSNENQDRLRVIALDTLRSWETHIKGEVFWNAWPTEDGRACLIRERTNPADSRLVDLACEYLPFLARFSSGGDYFSLYQSHDRLIARLPYTNNPPFTLCVSPDGRSLLFSPSDEELQLYRY